MRIRPQQQRLQWPLSPSQVEALDSMLETLYRAVRKLENTVETLPTGGVSSALAVSGIGPPGTDGEDGADGFPGIMGPAGATGATGPAGPSGSIISLGIPGYDGDDGQDGFPGVAGPTGPTGPTGATGASGTVLSIGIPGLDGEDADNAFPIPVTSQPRTFSMGIVIDGAGAAITTGIKGDLVVPVNCTIMSCTMLADQSGSIVVDIWKQVYASYPPAVGQTITASALPTISAALKSQDLTLTGWTRAVTAGDTLRFNVNSATSITRLTLTLKVVVN